MKRRFRPGTAFEALLSIAALIACGGVQAGPNWRRGFISGITFIDDYIHVSLSTGAPDSYAGSLWFHV